MSRTTLQKVDPIVDTAALVRERLEEESKTLPLGYGKLKLEMLAEILGGRAREPFWIGRGWNGIAGEGADPIDPASVAEALETGARKSTRVKAWGFVLTYTKGESLVRGFDTRPDAQEWWAETDRLCLKEHMRVMEQQSIIRIGNGGHESVPVTGLRGWAVHHAASAAGDFHYHTHVLISATAEKVGGGTGQISSRKLLQEDARLADASSRRVRAQRLQEIGLGVGLDGELVGIERDLIERASNARSSISAIKTHFASTGIGISDEVAWHHWRQIAEGKPDRSLPKSLIDAIHAARGEALGGEAIEHAMDEQLSDTERADAIREWLATKYELEDWRGITDKARAAWSEYPKYDDVTKVIALMATLGTAPTPYSVAALCARFADDDERPELMAKVGTDPRVLVGQYHWVLTSQLVREELLTQRTAKLLENTIPDMTIDKALSGTDGTALAVIMGVAGGGKSSALSTATKNWNDMGITVWATARNRMTATETGVAAGASPTHSLSTAELRGRLALGSPDTPRPGDLVVWEETGLLDHGDVEMLLSLAESGVKVKALGDSYQIQPIDGSTSARLVMDIAKERGMPSLDQTKRCESWKELHDCLRSVVTGESDTEEVLQQLDIRSAANIEQVVEVVGNLPGAEIAVRSNELRCRIAELLPRPEMPFLLGTDIPNVVMLRDDIAGWQGDQIVVRRNSIGKGDDGEAVRITNGEKGRIRNITPRGVVLEIEGRSLTISRDVAKTSIALGGVHTGDSAQGQTWQRAIVVITGTETREWLYSAATRGRNAPVFVVLSEDGEDGALVMKQVLRRQGIAQTVMEMCKTDEVLAQSVQKARGGNGTIGNLEASYASDLAEDTELAPDINPEQDVEQSQGNGEPFEFGKKIFTPWPEMPKVDTIKFKAEMLKQIERMREVKAIGRNPELRTQAELDAYETKIESELRHLISIYKPEKVASYEERLELKKEWEAAGDDRAGKSNIKRKVDLIVSADENNEWKAKYMAIAKKDAEKGRKILEQHSEATAKLTESLTPDELKSAYIFREEYLEELEETARHDNSGKSRGASYSQGASQGKSGGYGYGKGF